MNIPIADGPLTKEALEKAQSAEGLVFLDDKMRHQLHVEICKCPRCRGTLKTENMCTAHLFSEHFLTIGRCPPLVAKRLTGDS